MYKRISMAALAALTILSFGCDGFGDASASNAADTLTRRQKDSITSTMPLPGARGVGNAMKAADRIQARADQLDSLQRRRR